MTETEIYDFSLPSSDKLHALSCRAYIPSCHPFAVLQIVHGLGDTKERFDGMARYFREKGVVVCLCDQLGHGETAKEKKDLGFFSGKGGASFLTEDIDLLRREMRKKYRFLPYFQFGHGMGSLLLSRAITLYGNEIDGVVLSGVVSSSLPLGKANLALTSLALLKGRNYRPEKQWDEVKTRLNASFPGEGKYAFLSRDEKAGESFASSEFVPTISACLDILSLLKEISEEGWEEKPPRSLPVLIASGEEDPIGGNGEGARTLCDRLSEAGINDLTLRIYPKARHELYNGPDREIFFADLLGWAERVAEGAVEARTGIPVPGEGNVCG